MTPKQIQNYQIWSSVRARPQTSDSFFIRYASWVVMFHLLAFLFAAAVLGK